MKGQSVQSRTEEAAAAETETDDDHDSKERWVGAFSGAGGGREGEGRGGAEVVVVGTPRSGRCLTHWACRRWAPAGSRRSPWAWARHCMRGKLSATDLLAYSDTVQQQCVCSDNLGRSETLHLFVKSHRLQRETIWLQCHDLGFIPKVSLQARRPVLSLLQCVPKFYWIVMWYFSQLYTVILIYTPTSNQNPDMNKRS